MNLLSRLRAGVQVALSDRPIVAGRDDSGNYVVQAIDLGAMLGSSSPDHVPTKISKNQLEKYFIRWAFAAASQIGFGIMMAGYNVQTRSSDTAEWEDDPDGPMATMLHDVNPFMTGQEFWYWVAVELAMVGESYWRIVMNGLNEPAEMYPLSGEMTPTVASDRVELLNWKHKYKNNKGIEKTDELTPEEVMFLRIPKPGSFWEGYGLAEAAAAEIGLDKEATRSMWAKYKQGIFPSAILSMATQDEKKRAEYLAKFNDKYTGAGKAGRTIGIAKTMDVKFPPMSPLINDVKGREWLRDTILAVMKVPKSMLGMDVDANRASIWGMHTVLARNTLQPIVRMVTARVNQDVAPLYGESQRLVFDDIAPEDKELTQKQEQQDLELGVRTINEIRAARGLDAVPWGDEPLVSAGLRPLSEGAPGGPGQQKLELYSGSERDRIVRAWTDSKERYQNRYAAFMEQIFNALTKDIIDALERDYGQQGPETPNVDSVIEVTKLKERIARNKSKIDRQGVYLGGEFNSELAGDAEVEWDEQLPIIDSYTNSYGGAYVDEMASATHEAIKETISEGLANRNTFDEIKGAIIDKMGQMSESRAAMIAHTETTRMWNAGGDAFRNHNKVPKKQWVTSFVNSRETHQDADGQIVGQGENFRVGADNMPFPGSGSLAEENVNCGCVAVGVF